MRIHFCNGHSLIISLFLTHCIQNKKIGHKILLQKVTSVIYLFARTKDHSDVIFHNILFFFFCIVSLLKCSINLWLKYSIKQSKRPNCRLPFNQITIRNFNTSKDMIIANFSMFLHSSVYIIRLKRVNGIF